MRLWTLHPRHLDAIGLVALWREALLAQAVLLGRTRGYTRHPQLQRFQTAADPVACIADYLLAASICETIVGIDKALTGARWTIRHASGHDQFRDLRWVRVEADEVHREGRKPGPAVEAREQPLQRRRALEILR